MIKKFDSFIYSFFYIIQFLGAKVVPKAYYVPAGSQAQHVHVESIIFLDIWRPHVHLSALSH